jgi:tRNA threonylcarbamoyladenosine biosynthesis protein TsaB
LWFELEGLIREAGLTTREIDAFAVSVGPGGFTGLRVGIAAVKGLAAATHKPVVGLTSLEIAAAGAAQAGRVCAMVNAYKGEVYSQLFSFDSDLVPAAENAPAVTAFGEALERVATVGDLVFAGDAAIAMADQIRAAAAERFDRGEWKLCDWEAPVADSMARLAAVRVARGEAQDAADVRACYVRPSEAELKLSKGLLGSKIRRVTSRRSKDCR